MFFPAKFIYVVHAILTNKQLKTFYAWFQIEISNQENQEIAMTLSKRPPKAHSP